MKRVLLALLLALGVSATSHAQISVDTDFAVGIGFELQGEDEAVFQADSIFGALHWNGLKLPGPNTSTGLGVEFHPGTLSITEDAEGNTVANVDYRLWSLNRVSCPGATYCIADMKIGEGGEGGWRNDFDLRTGIGIEFAKWGTSRWATEIYFLEDDRPVSFMLTVRWGGTSGGSEDE